MPASCGLEPPITTVGRDDALPRDRPLVIYDGDCGFCVKWATRWSRLAGDTIDVIAFQMLGDRLPEVDREACAKAVHLVEPASDGLRIFRGAEAATRAQARSTGHDPDRGVLGTLLPPLQRVLNAPYAMVARHRDVFNRMAPLMYGKLAVPETYQVSRGLFLRFIAFTYLVAFLSFGVQAQGLVGSSGILPVSEYLASARDTLGPSAWIQLPTLLWISSSDAAITTIWIAGCIAGVLVLFGIAPMYALIACWGLYLSLVHAGQDFLSFQWDILLLEAGFLAILYAPASLLTARTRPGWLARLLITWLLFRLMFESGILKLLSGDAAWLDGSALSFHWYTQPLPTWAAWWMAQLPGSVEHLLTWGMFIAELGLPLLLFLPRVPRTTAALGIIGLMIGIGVTGNYGFFNLLTIALCIAVLDDGVLKPLLRPKRLFARWRSHRPLAPPTPPPQRIATILAAIVIVPGSIVLGWADAERTVENARFQAAADDPIKVQQLIDDLEENGPSWARRLSSNWRSFRTYGIVNSYGLFRVMTTTRPELTIEASDDGSTWSPYVFKYKPGPLDRKPVFAGLHMPRLDWQMWFAGLSAERGQLPIWFQRFILRLQEADPAVLELLDSAPMGDAPPPLLRVRLGNYLFTNSEQRDDTGNWWLQENDQLLVPPIPLPESSGP
ncbi:MAG: lipase maturation factor family protein [Phycisphaerales bacterium]|nr:lipase maturation factor family protein [Phycisphaerales bacterium]